MASKRFEDIARDGKKVAGGVVFVLELEAGFLHAVRINTNIGQAIMNRTISRILLHIAWIGCAICLAHVAIGTPKPFLMECFIQTGFASGCFFVASFLKD